MNRREALAAIGSGIIVSDFFLQTPINKILKITYLCNNERKIKEVDLNIDNYESTFDLGKAISSGIWWPDGSTAGVYESVEYQRIKYNFYSKGYMAAASPYSQFPEYNYCDFCTEINEKYTLKMNRFWYCVENNFAKHVAVGASVCFPNGENGYTWNKSKKIYFGKELERK